MKMNLNDIKLDGFTLNEKEKAMYGSRNGITVLIELGYVSLSKEVTHRISATLDMQYLENQEKFLSKIRSLEEQYEYVSYAGCISDNTIAIVIDGDMNQAKTRLEYLVYEFTQICNDYQLQNKCAICNNSYSTEYICVDNEKKPMCERCYSRLMNSLSEVITKKDIVILGFIGAIIGALIGSILWIVLDQVGFIAGIAGYAIVYCCAKGYELLGRTISKRGIVICIFVSVFMILFADCFSLGISIYRQFQNEFDIAFVDALLSVPEFLKDTEILKSLLLNLVIGYLFAIWASGSFIKALWIAVDKPKVSINVRKL